MSASETKPWMLWAGRVVSALPVLMLAMSASVKFMNKPEITDSFVNHFGYPAGTLFFIALAEVTCTLLYVIPRTAVLGAILLTGYLGGAVATHVRVSEPFLIPIFVGVLVWLGLFLRDGRLRALLPLRAAA